VWSNEPVETSRQAAPSGTPSSLGPYAVVGRWHTEAGGQVLSGRDGAGGEAELVLMAPGPGSDAASRDRFAAAAEDLSRQHPGRVLSVNTSGPIAWTALTPGSGPSLAGPLLRACIPPGSDAAPAAGPEFSPHWSRSGAAYPAVGAPLAAPASTPEGRSGWKRWWWLGLVTLGVLLLLVLLSSCWPRGDGGQQPGPTGNPTSPGASPAPTPSSTGPPSTGPNPSGTDGSPSPGESAAGEPAPQQPLAQGPVVSGPVFTDEETVELRLEGLPFPFRVPAGWECVRSDSPPSVLYLCMDAAAVSARPEIKASAGFIEVTPCDEVCDDLEWALLRALRSEEPGWRLVDEGTVVAEDTDPVAPTFQRIRMSRVYDPAGGEEPTTHVYAEFVAAPENYDDARKIVNDIRANTP